MTQAKVGKEEKLSTQQLLPETKPAWHVVNFTQIYPNEAT